MKSIVYVGMDVPKNSFNLCAIDSLTGEILGESRIASDIDLVEKFVKNVKAKASDSNAEILTGYEAGCLGYSLYKQLESRNIKCDISAPSTMQKSAKEKLRKNDKMDAKNIATNLSNGAYKSVYVPNDHDIEVKQYIRMIGDFKDEFKKTKQHINAFLLSNGYKYPGKSHRTLAHIKWIKELECTEMHRVILDEYMDHYESLESKLERFNHKLEELSQEEPYKEKVGQLRSFKGIDTAAAMTIQVEISDFTRFPNAEAFISYVGLTPGENSSGDKAKRTSITKQGNSTVRKTLIECSRALVRGTVGVKSKRVKARQVGQEVKIIAYADKGVLRLQKKYHHMIKKNKNPNVAITAIARELAGFVWGMETGRINLSFKSIIFRRMKNF